MSVRPRFLLGLIFFYFVLNLGDCVSTYLCLTALHESYNVGEANPLSAWLFAQVGLVHGLALSSVIKVALSVWLYRLVLRQPGLLTFATLGMAFAVSSVLWANLNNWYIWSLIRS